MTSVAKIIEVGALMARTWYSDDEAECRLLEPMIERLSDIEFWLAHFACKMMLAEKPYGIKATGSIDPRFYEIAELLGAHALPCLEWADDIISTYFVPPGVDIPTGEAA
jgi:hypothetical protein